LFSLTAVVTICGHLFCSHCLTQTLAHRRDQGCPICRGELDDEDFVPLPQVKRKIEALGLNAPRAAPRAPSPVPEPQPDNGEKTTWVSSTKINALMTKLGEIMAVQQGEKTIVFSQFTTMLDLLEHPLNLAGYQFVRYDGSMSLPAREDTLKKFRGDKTIRILLMSLKCGGLGLNLTVASRVFMMDCWWNPALEDQAIDRCHRIGQARDVKVIRLTIADTVEDRILKLQEGKKAIADGALGEGELKKMPRLTLNDLIYLFRGGKQE